MDPDKWDTTVWYRVTRNLQSFRGLTGCQRDPRILGVTFINPEYDKITKIPLCHVMYHKSKLVAPLTYYFIHESKSMSLKGKCHHSAPLHDPSLHIIFDRSRSKVKKIKLRRCSLQVRINHNLENFPLLFIHFK